MQNITPSVQLCGERRFSEQIYVIKPYLSFLVHTSSLPRSFDDNPNKGRVVGLESLLHYDTIGMDV
jgi:hypothetical protein